MRFLIDFLKAGLVMLRLVFPIWGGITILSSLLRLFFAQFEEELSDGNAHISPGSPAFWQLSSP